MVIGDTVVRLRAFVPWDATEGVPELIIPPLPTGGYSDPSASVRANVRVRSLPDGTPLLLAPGPLWARFVGRVRLIRLSSPAVRVDIATDGLIWDAVMDTDGHAIVLEQIKDRFAVRAVRPDGTTAWTMKRVAAQYHSQLLADTQGRVFLTCTDAPDHAPTMGDVFLTRVDDRSGHVVARREGCISHMYPDGRVIFTRWDDTRDSWVILDPQTGTESVIEDIDNNRVVMSGLIGLDADGRLYGKTAIGGDCLGRMTSAGHIDWLLDIDGIAASQRHGAAMLVRDDQGSDNGVVLYEEGRVWVNTPPECEDATLKGRRDDGGYMLHKVTNRNDHGTLVHLDPHGRLITTEPAGSDANLTVGDFRMASKSSVTPDGEVLVTVLNPAGVHVVGLKASS
ncbi:hypothetical protein [Actinomadura alba]|uniref:Uncharacterized protein n=1 Tax=Actinomadura alba TaxID=406431 RepID=A0ABR7LVB2_9ACTN|nr:hypothetical protein [Actinomadura alba]MBC6468782.1 hypothetical protein [Actinomadura alba]